MATARLPLMMGSIIRGVLKRGSSKAKALIITKMGVSIEETGLIISDMGMEYINRNLSTILGTGKTISLRAPGQLFGMMKANLKSLFATDMKEQFTIISDKDLEHSFTRILLFMLACGITIQSKDWDIQ